MQDYKIEVYPLNCPVSVVPTGRDLELTAEQSAFIDAKWEANHKGWASAFIPFAESLHFLGGETVVHAGLTNYKEQRGLCYAITEKMPFAPESRGVTGLGSSIYGITEDAVILQRRSAATKQMTGQTMFIAGGWNSSLNIVRRKECEDPIFATDVRLYNADWQANKEMREESGLTSADYLLINPFAIVRQIPEGNLAISYLANIKKPTQEVVETMRHNKDPDGKAEYDLVMALPREALPDLLINQADIYSSGQMPSKDEKDPRKQFLMPEAIGGFMILYLTITGKEIPGKVHDALKKANISLEDPILTWGHPLGDTWHFR